VSPTGLAKGVEHVPTYFEQQVRAAIELWGWSYSDLARASGVSASMIGRFMTGEREMGSGSLGKLIDAMGCTLSAPTKAAPPRKHGRPRNPIAREMVDSPLHAGRCPNQKRSGEIRTRRREREADAEVAAAAEGEPKN
jgi:hypothetical protein